MPTPTADSRPIAGKRTPPELKWLLNERAALAGEALRQNVLEQRLANRLLRLDPLLQRTQADLDKVRRAQLDTAKRVAALDRTMALAEARLNPEAGGTVNAWAGRYGERGALTEFVRDTLEKAAPYFISQVSLRTSAIAHFGLHVGTWQELHAMRGSLRSALERLRAKGLVEREKGSSKGQQPAMWRWKAGPTLDDLRALVAADWPIAPQQPSDEHHPHPDSAHGEVARQRTGSNGG